MDVSARFAFFVDADRRNRLKNQLRNLRTDELVFVVDSRLPQAEMEWIHQKVRVNKSTLGEVYFSVPYDEDRLNQQLFDWPHESYRMEVIRQKGGICVDQAYYAVEVARAYGIPALYFQGMGRRGGHAWFGYLKGASGWDMDVGRYTYDKFATGHAEHPQTRQILSDHDLELIGRAIRRQAPFRRSLQLSQAAALFLEEPADTQRALSLLDEAIRAERRNPLPWNMKTVLLQHAQGGGDLIEKHLRDMIAQFASSSDLRTRTELALLKHLETSGRIQEAADMRKSLIRKKAGDRHDVSMKLVSEQLAQALKKNDSVGALRDFERAVEKFSRESGAVLELLFSFASDCLEHGQVETAQKAIEFVEKKISFDVLTRRYLDDFKEQFALISAGTAE
nr:hypothetical protein [Oscillatoria laete-virens]